MAITRVARAAWQGDLFQGAGTVTFDSSGIGSFAVSWPAQREAPQGLTTPAELIAAAQASCFSITLAHELTKAGSPPRQLTTQAEVVVDDPAAGDTAPDTVATIHLTVNGDVPGLDEDGFVRAAQDAKANCPVCQALSGTTILLTAVLS